MSDDDECQMDVDQEDIVPISLGAKGKGKLTEPIAEDDNLPWVEKYRPVSLDDVVSHDDITKTIDKFIEGNRLPHLLFYGPPGTGKTSTILAVARRIYGKEYKRFILELNASDDRGIDVVEKKINEVIEKEGVKITDDGKAALLKLSKGDMRRALNILQACHAAYDLTDETAIYNCTGNPQPSDIDAVVKSMMTEEFTTSYMKISQLKIERGLALQDLIAGVYEYIDTIDFPPHTRIYLLDHLATTEHRLSTGGSEKLQLTALLSAFKNAVEISVEK
ncbi:hypothetical protein FRB98_002856 [Tulasnella sp. 332]|nr:hypothetical protein FRB98_002856 [Tulasnella sp. 332]